MKLVIVESPTKVATIQKYLGSDYKVMATKGHLRDIAKSGKYSLGVDIESGNFEATYEEDPAHASVIKQLKKEYEKCDELYLATDPDREGEAIAWHVCCVLGIDPSVPYRLEFHEITRYGVANALENIRKIDMNLVEAQETRRIMDRIIGFRLSFLCQSKLQALAAGRVQSPVLDLIYTNHLERKNFVPTYTYDLLATIDRDAKLKAIKLDGKDINITSSDEATKILENLPKEAKLINIEREEKPVTSPYPFTTSTLMQDASRIYRYTAATTIKLASDLFYAGYITYMRTDSVRFSPEFINKAKAVIAEKCGDDFVGVAKKQGSQNGVQDAHEAIRPTDLAILKESIESMPGHYMTAQHKNIYDLIYRRALQSMMKPRIEEIYTYTFECGNLTLEYKSNKVIFAGFSVLDAKQKEKIPTLDINLNDNVSIFDKTYETIESKPEPFYNEGTLVKKMEDCGIGRPSTYASTITNLISKSYVEEKNNHLEITRMGKRVVRFLRDWIKETINLEYTANLETILDEIASAEYDKLVALNELNNAFVKEFEYALKESPIIPPDETDEVCPKCGAPLIYKIGKYGEFIGCSACNYSKPSYTGENCPKCGAPLIYKFKPGNPPQKFVACSNFPACKYTDSVEKKFYRKKAVKK